MTLVTLHKSKSKFDFVHKGTPIQFEVQPCNCGVTVAFVRELKLKETMPEPFILMQGKDPESISERKGAIEEEHIELKWWEKLIGITLEKKVTRWATKVRNEYANSESVAERIRTFVSQ